MSKLIGLSVVLAATLGFSSLAFAAAAPQAGAPASPPASASSSAMHHGKGHGMHHRRGHHGRMGVLSKLDLSDTQRSEIRQMMQQSFKQARPEMQMLRQKRTAFENATPGSDAYQSTASELATASANAARERVTRKAELRTKVYGKLTSEQRTKLASLRAERRERMQEWRSSHARHPTAASATTSSPQ